MKRLMVFLLTLFLLYIMYYDISTGTIAFSPPATDNEPAAAVQSSPSPFTVKEIKQGETVLTIVEQLHSGLPVSIEQVRKDFEKLNPNAKADAIQVGKAYKFPLYEKEVAS
ncbi:hypothetical protein [Metabacillus sp. SLBN-84]